MRRRIALGLIVSLGGLAISVSAVEQSGHDIQKSDQKIVAIQKIKEHLYLATGGGGNSAIFVTDLGVVIVDTKLPGWGQPLLAKIKTITDKPIVTIINTHAHADHVGGNEAFGAAVEIVAHENTRLAMDKMEAFRGEKTNFLPKLVFKDKMTLGAGTDRIDLYHFGPGHTNGDTWVVFPTARVVHAGDMFAAQEPPLIDSLNGGSGLAYPDTVARADAGIRNVETIITGDSTLRPWKDLATYANFTRDFRDFVVDGFNHGLGVGEIVEAWKLPPKYAGYTAPPEHLRAAVEALIGELSR
ncbi:MAG TPA: MBL fold metallo-hydrolase [Vicinamibacterales bacterium]|nr:MBL fold metallo-hydrolase [Vicinamibacterales bacterium]